MFNSTEKMSIKNKGEKYDSTKLKSYLQRVGMAYPLMLIQRRSKVPEFDGLAIKIELDNTIKKIKGLKL
ncbi:MAG: hypothetical protein HQM10_10855 [Candidatus Riflebacteria bacterium]|nr:hypothetical protein [Candidatus Riflebacteria bacterium]